MSSIYIVIGANLLALLFDDASWLLIGALLALGLYFREKERALADYQKGRTK